MEASFSAYPRFEGSTWARQLIASAGGERIHGMDGEKQSTYLQSGLVFVTESGERAALFLTRRSEVLREPVTIQDRELGVGEYDFDGAHVRFNTDDSRTFSMGAGFGSGEFWSGTGREVSVGGMWKTGRYLTVRGNYSRNTISLPVEDGDFVTQLFSATILGAVSRSLFANALIQYDDVSNLMQANVRIDWIHTPGSDLFVVFDTGYLTGDLLDPRVDRWQRRTGVVKLTYLKAF